MTASPDGETRCSAEWLSTSARVAGSRPRYATASSSHSRSVSSGCARKNASWASSASCRRAPGPVIHTGLSSPLSSQNRMNTRGQHPRHGRLGHPVVAPGDPRGGRSVLVFRLVVLLLPAALPAPGQRRAGRAGRPPAPVPGAADRWSVRLSRSRRPSGGRNAVLARTAVRTVAAVREPWSVSIQSDSRRKNWPGAASGSGRPSMTAPWLPGSCGTSSQIACVRRVARSARGAEYCEVAVPGQRRDLGEQDRAGALGGCRAGIVDRGVDRGQAALHQDGRARRPRGFPAARRRRPGPVSHGRPAAAACSRMASISSWVTSSLSLRTCGPARRQRGRACSSRRLGRGRIGRRRSRPAGGLPGRRRPVPARPAG